MIKTKGLTFHIVEMSPVMYICLFGWLHCLFCLVLHTVSSRVCAVGGHDVWLGSLHGRWIHMIIGNWRVVVFDDILTIRNTCHWTLINLIPLCLGWRHGHWNCWWWLVLDLLGSVPILQGWFGGGWRFCSHVKVLLFLLHMQMTLNVWSFQIKLI